jgi:hypothetical protein
MVKYFFDNIPSIRLLIVVAPQGSQVLRHFLHWLGFYIILVWQWLLIGIGTRIFGSFNRNRNAKDGHFRK